jgi:hypothetical protein
MPLEASSKRVYPRIVPLSGRPETPESARLADRRHPLCRCSWLSHARWFSDREDSNLSQGAADLPVSQGLVATRLTDASLRLLRPTPRSHKDVLSRVLTTIWMWQGASSGPRRSAGMCSRMITSAGIWSEQPAGPPRPVVTDSRSVGQLESMYGVKLHTLRCRRRCRRFRGAVARVQPQ